MLHENLTLYERGELFKLLRDTIAADRLSRRPSAFTVEHEPPALVTAVRTIFYYRCSQLTGSLVTTAQSAPEGVREPTLLNTEALPMPRFDASRSWWASPAMCLLLVSAMVLLAVGSPASAANGTMFEGARAQEALAAVTAKVGHKLWLLNLDITADALEAKIQDPAEPDRLITWRVSTPDGWKSVLGDVAVKGRSSEPTLYMGALDENLFDLAPADL